LLDKYRHINISLFLFIYSFSALAFVYTSQYAFGLMPCILCMYQRLPFFAVLLVSAISLFIKNKFRLVLVALCGALLLVGTGIAFYHVGVEQGKFEVEGGCEAGSEIPSTLEEMTTQLLGKPNVPCNKPQFVFLGVSMAGWNFLFSGAIGLMTLIMVGRTYRTLRDVERSNEYQKNKK
jgi:disulfide bond formation protein DsbB